MTLRDGFVDFSIVAKCTAKTADEVRSCKLYGHDDATNPDIVSCKARTTDGDDFVCGHYDIIMGGLERYIKNTLGLFAEDN